MIPPVYYLLVTAAVSVKSFKLDPQYRSGEFLTSREHGLDTSNIFHMQQCLQSSGQFNKDLGQCVNTSKTVEVCTLHCQVQPAPPPTTTAIASTPSPDTVTVSISNEPANSIEGCACGDCHHSTSYNRVCDRLMLRRCMRSFYFPNFGKQRQEYQQGLLDKSQPTFYPGAHQKIEPVPVTYELEDYRGEPVQGGFYAEEIVKTKVPTVFEIAKVLKRRGNKLLVRWKGYDRSHDSWIDRGDLVTHHTPRTPRQICNIGNLDAVLTLITLRLPLDSSSVLLREGDGGVGVPPGPPCPWGGVMSSGYFHCRHIKAMRRVSIGFICAVLSVVGG
ncbi:hypothetical protein LSTR_LSTR006974 [Laodelphax striatellus]|uniref:Chromo domain-containing protein n=1 Tax=Laodelphax striatellus TaxID=195883 RepID=A0A482WQX2_LAOST|nr:hypothetical protein LSTR_LSTR006974 [Laodelphax striatellus]